MVGRVDFWLAWSVALAGLALAVLAAPAAAAQPARVALVVGIGAYKHLPQLINAVGDARLIADKLRTTGFDVDLQTDVTRAQLDKAVRDFAHRIEAAGPDAVSMVYYAGHGVQDDRQSNFLIGADADVRSQVDLPLQALSLDGALQTLEAARPKLSFVVLDACRDDPLPVSASRGARRGLAVEADRRGLLIAFSTEPGKTAEDGPAGGHSPFAAALAEELDTPGLEAAQLFKLVTKKVLDATHEDQFPWVNQRLVDDFYFRPGPPAAAVVALAAPAAPASLPQPAAPGGEAAEIAYGQAVLDNTTEAYEGWLRQYPDSERKTSVMALLQRLREEELWRRANAAPTADESIRSLEVELLAFPSGIYAERARQRLAELQGQHAPAIADPPPTVLPSFDCARAVTVVEKQICASPALAAQDRQLAATFASVLARSTAPLDLQRSESAWVKNRDGCADRVMPDAVAACVGSAYQSRLAALQRGDQDPGDQPAQTAAPSFNCAYARTAVEKLICTTPSLAQDDQILVALFVAVQRTTPSAGALRSAQFAWRQRRDGCAAQGSRSGIIACVDQAYRTRIVELQAWPH